MCISFIVFILQCAGQIGVNACSYKSMLLNSVHSLLTAERCLWVSSFRAGYGSLLFQLVHWGHFDWKQTWMKDINQQDWINHQDIKDDIAELQSNVFIVQSGLITTWKFITIWGFDSHFMCLSFVQVIQSYICYTAVTAVLQHIGVPWKIIQVHVIGTLSKRLVVTSGTIVLLVLERSWTFHCHILDVSR